MKIKHIILSLLPVGAALLSACSDIDPKDRFIELPPVETHRVVLLEEFTGQVCPNCPAAHEEIEKLLAQYPDNLIAVSIHAGFQSISEEDDDYFGLATAEGEQYANMWGVERYPCGMVNRETALNTSGQWAADIRAAVQKPSLFTIEGEAVYDPANGDINIASTITSSTKRNANVELWIVESGIKNYQIFIDGSASLDYVHNHVFRATVNGVDGEDMFFAANTPTDLKHSIKKVAKWQAENLSVVIFLYDAKGVLQAAQVPVKTKQ